MPVFWLAEGSPGGCSRSSPPPTKGRRERAQEPCSCGKMATGAQARGSGSGRKGRLARRAGRPPTPTAPRPLPPAYVRGREKGRNGAGGGARAACRETWSAGGGRRGAVPAGSSPRQSFVAQPRPAPPGPLFHQGGAGQQLLPDSRGSRHREFPNSLDASAPLPLTFQVSLYSLPNHLSLPD